MNLNRAITLNLNYLLASCLLLGLIGCQTKPTVRQAQRKLKVLVQTSVPIFEQDHIALLHCSNGADLNKIKQAIIQTKRAISQWFADQSHPQKYTSRLLIFTPDEPLGKQLLREMKATHLVAGSTEARTHTILIAGYPSQDDFWTTLRHELTHDAMLRHYQNAEHLPPFWITEGLATVFEVPTNQDGQPPINPGRLKRLQSVIRQDKLNFSPLLTRGADQSASSNAYAQAWGLTFYLISQHPSAIRRYLADSQQTNHQTSDAQQKAFDRFFQIDLPLSEWFLKLPPSPTTLNTPLNPILPK